MSTTTASPPVRAMPLSGNVDWLKTDPAYQGYTLLRIGFAVAPIAFGVDKFLNVMVNWEQYPAPWIRHLNPLSATHTIRIVGVIETAAGIAVAIKPRYGVYPSPPGSAASSSTYSHISATTTSRYATSD